MGPATAYWAPSSPGDLADRWTILTLKVQRASDDAKREAATRRLSELALPVYDDTSAAIVAALARVNERLWDLEDDVRRLMASSKADAEPAFVRVARAIPLLNDTRAHLKARIDELMGHGTHDVKMYN
ncbi:MAG: hypothetical protein EBS48_10090 [Actinobacteria bacterium]|nr:hypothetical protein [Actinomycetota bacterium]